MTVVMVEGCGQGFQDLLAAALAVAAGIVVRVPFLFPVPVPVLQKRRQDERVSLQVCKPKCRQLGGVVTLAVGVKEVVIYCR